MPEASRRPPTRSLSRDQRRSQAIRYVNALDGIRALAALGIVIIHTESEADASMLVYGLTGFITGPFFMSFFIITGFVVYRGWARRHLATHDPPSVGRAGTADGGSDGRRGRFLLRRLIRIYPLYWVVATTAMIVGSEASDHSYGIIDRIQVYLLLPWPRLDNLVELGLGLIVWTLVLDVFFYVYVTIHGAVMTRVVAAFPTTSPFRVELAVLIPMIAVPFLLSPFVPAPIAVLACLPIGMMGAVFEAHHDRTGRRVAIVQVAVEYWALWLGIALVIGPYYVWTIRDLDDFVELLTDVWPIPGLLVVGSAFLLCTVLWGPRRWPFNRLLSSEQMQIAARYTYGLYLWHPVIHIVLREQFPNTSLGENLLITIIGSSALAFVTYHLLEEPLTRVRSRLRQQPAA